MKSLPAVCVVGVAACLLVGAARGDDALDALFRAGKNLHDAHVWRAETTTTNAVEPAKSGVSVSERVDPGKTQYIQEHDGKPQMEMCRDGPRALIRLGPDGEFEDAGRSVAVLLARLRQASVWPLAENLEGEVLPTASSAKGLKAARHETFDGKPVTVFTFSADDGGAHRTGERWISDGDSILLKSVSERKGEIKTDKGTTQVDEHAETIYDYDPTLKINLPEAKAPAPEKRDPEVTSPKTSVSLAQPSAASLSSLPCASFFSIVFPASAAT